MNSFTKVAKAAIVGIVLSGSLLSMTACDNRSQPAVSAPTSPAVSQSASATPAASPAESKAPVVAGPLGVDVNDVVANHIHPTVAMTFPTETPETLKEGVTFALTTYQKLVTGNNFYRPRTASDITLLAPDKDKFDITYYDAMTARATANGGVIRDDFIAFGKGGEITGGSLGVHVMDPNKSVQFVSGPPVVYAGATANGNVLVVKGSAKLMAPTADNKLVTMDVDYEVSVSHADPGQRLVKNMVFRIPNKPVVTDSVAAPEAPNGK